MLSSFHIFLEHLINSTYQHQRERLTKFYGKIHELATSYILFGGWEINYNGRGRSLLKVERVGNIKFISKIVYFNINYTYHLANPMLSPFFSFYDLINTIAHELSHCLLGDFNPNWSKLHDEMHAKLAKEIEDYLWTLSEIKEWERLNRLFAESNSKRRSLKIKK
jgi:hypothetical protein